MKTNPGGTARGLLWACVLLLAAPAAHPEPATLVIRISAGAGQQPAFGLRNAVQLQKSLGLHDVDIVIAAYGVQPARAGTLPADGQGSLLTGAWHGPAQQPGHDPVRP